MADFSFLDAICGDDRDVIEETTYNRTTFHPQRGAGATPSSTPRERAPWSRDRLRLNCIGYWRGRACFHEHSPML